VAKSRDEYESGMLKRAAMAAFGPNKDHLPARVYPGGLSVSRTIGDVVVKKKAPGCVGEEPDLFTTIIDPCCEFLIMACDGIWDVLTSEDAVREVSEGSCNTLRDVLDHN
jgi:serine/threonine protein phosphatase PrpC